ncbi:MAG TPA: DegT/DnrJ/EryC1/StrS family aminotransferase [Bryobacteraceae bacterium]|nr:DegT/DnrJ/EryC1/StrS family aminotransferase [Bryobacteraceae bacterium]
MIPVFRPQLDADAVWAQLRPVIESGWLGQGPKVEELEAALAAELGVKHFILTSSGTAALHLAVKALRLPRGARVLTTPITFVSTNAALLWEGLVPVFGEADADGQLCSVGPWEHQTVATMAVHLGGARCWIEEIPGTPVIEDCAHAFGAPWLKDSHPLMRTWSFHAVKNLPMGDGGGISTNDDEIAAQLRRLRWMGITKSTHARNQGGYATEYSIPELGWKYHMNDVTAAIGLATLPLVAGQVRRRQEIAARYREAFPDNSPSYLPADSACHFYPLFFDDRAVVEERLRTAGVAFSRHYRPNFLYPDFRGYPVPGYESAMRYWDRALILPMFPGMTDAEIEHVISAIRGEGLRVAA